MMETAQTRARDHRRLGRWLLLNWPAIRRILFQGVVNAVLVVIAHIITHEPAEMLFVQRDHMVQDLSATASDPSFGGSILPGRLDARPFWFQTRRLQKRNHVSIEFRIAVQDDVTVWTSFRKGLAQLLDDPLRSRVAGHVEVRDPAPSVLDHEEAVEQLKGHRRHREEVEGDDHLAVVPEKRQPAFARVTAAADTPKIPGDGLFRDDVAELQKLAVNLGSAPGRVLFRQAPDQNTNLFGDLRPAALRAGPPPPVEAKPGPVSADDCLGLHDDEDVGPAGPQVMQGGPEEPVERVQGRPRAFSLEDRNLLSEGENFKGGVTSTAKEDSDGGED